MGSVMVFLTNLATRRSFTSQSGWSLDICAETVLTRAVMGAGAASDFVVCVCNEECVAHNIRSFVLLAHCI